MFKKLGLTLTSMLVMSAIAVPSAFAGPGPGPGPGPAAGPKAPPTPPTPPSPPAPGPGPGGSDFVLTGLTGTANSDMNPTAIDMTVTVAQIKPDGSDFAEDKTATTETHNFPGTIYVYMTTDGSTTGPYAATLDSTVGITYSKNAAPGTTVSATADYTLVPSNVLTALYNGQFFTQNYTLSLYSSTTKGDTMTFRMGPYEDGSWSDDIVGGTSAFTPVVPVYMCP